MPTAAYLLPNFDEYTVAYRQRDLFYDPANNWTGDPRQDVPFGNVIVVEGRVVGRWKPVRRRDELKIESRWTSEPSNAACRALDVAVQRYRAFLGTPQLAS